MEPIKVFIAEDESIVREGLRDMIPWEQYGFAFVGDAPDGEMALPLIRKLKPDILITDIRMPFMDGLALSRIVSRELPDTKIIITSGYSDFEYARQAIELKVDQYLLKPLTRADMIKALESTRQKIEDGRAQKDYLRKYEQELKEFERFSRRTFFEKLVDGSLSVQEIYEQAEKLNLDLTADGYNFVVFAVQDAQRTAYTAAAANVVEQLLDYFFRYPDYVLFRCGLLSYAVLVKGDAAQLARLTERGLDMIRQRCEGAQTPLNWYAAVGAPVSRLSSLAQCYAEANHVLAYRHIYPAQHIFTADMIRAEQEAAAAEGMDAVQAGMVDPMALRNFVQTGTPEEAAAFAEEYTGSLGGAEHSLMFRHYLMVSARVNAEFALRELGVSAEELQRRLPQVDVNMQPDRLKTYLAAVLRAAVELREAESQKRSSDITSEALRYIDRNYTDPNISLNSVAESINISANYLSALFSQKTGLSCVEYLTKKRMARARQLLRQTSKRSGEIAAEVGYRDPRYFSFVFKKTQGCTPSSYRSGGTE